MTFAANHPARRDQAKVMNRFDITQRMVARLKHDEAVIGGIGYTNFDLWAAGRRPQNFYMLGSMGLAVPIALGVALAQPRRKVIALEGDGSILMHEGHVIPIEGVPARAIDTTVSHRKHAAGDNGSGAGFARVSRRG